MTYERRVQPYDVGVVAFDLRGSGRGWQPLDLATLATTMRTASAANTPGAVPAQARFGWPPLATPFGPERRVPADAFVTIARAIPPSRTSVPTIAPARPMPLPGSADPPSPWRRRLREMFFLAILALTIAIAFYGGKLHGFQKIIVVPGPSSSRSMVT